MIRVPFNEKDKFLSNMPETTGFSVVDTGVKNVDIINKKGILRKVIKKVSNKPKLSSPWS